MRAVFLRETNKKGEITIANISINPSNLPCKHSAGDFSFHLWAHLSRRCRVLAGSKSTEGEKYLSHSAPWNPLLELAEIIYKTIASPLPEPQRTQTFSRHRDGFLVFIFSSRNFNTAQECAHINILMVSFCSLRGRKIVSLHDLRLFTVLWTSV